MYFQAVCPALRSHAKDVCLRTVPFSLEDSLMSLYIALQQCLLNCNKCNSHKQAHTILRTLQRGYLERNPTSKQFAVWQKFCYKFKSDVLRLTIIKLLGQALSFTSLIYHKKKPKLDICSSQAMIPLQICQTHWNLGCRFDGRMSSTLCTNSTLQDEPQEKQAILCYPQY